MKILKGTDRTEYKRAKIIKSECTSEGLELLLKRDFLSDTILILNEDDMSMINAALARQAIRDAQNVTVDNAIEIPKNSN